MQNLETEIISALETLFPSTLFILSGQNGVEPKSVYCLVKVLSTDNIGLGEDDLFNINQTTRYASNKIINLRLQHFGLSTSSARGDAEYLNMVLSCLKGRYEFYQKGLSITKVEGVSDFEVLRDTQMYRTHINDITLLTKSVITFENPSIDSSTILANYITDSGESNEEFTLGE